MAYPASKAAVNMITVRYAHAFRKIRINAVEPGNTATDPNLHQGTQAAEIIVPMAQVGPDVPPAVASTLRDRCPGRPRRLPGQGPRGLVDEVAEVIDASLAVEGPAPSASSWLTMATPWAGTGPGAAR